MNNKEEEKEDMGMISLKEALAVGRISTALYALYVQYNPKIGNIWIRKDDEGENVFVPKNFLKLMGRPLHDTDFWRPENLDMNWVFLTLSSIGLYASVKKLSK